MSTKEKKGKKTFYVFFFHFVAVLMTTKPRGRGKKALVDCPLKKKLPKVKLIIMFKGTHGWSNERQGKHINSLYALTSDTLPKLRTFACKVNQFFHGKTVLLQLWSILKLRFLSLHAYGIFKLCF